jgi:hypothetical protein
MSKIIIASGDRKHSTRLILLVQKLNLINGMANYISHVEDHEGCLEVYCYKLFGNNDLMFDLLKALWHYEGESEIELHQIKF